MASLKGKSIRSKPKPVIRDDIEIPDEIYTNNSNLDLWIDVIYINSLEFLVSIDKQIKYRAIIHVRDQDAAEFFKCLDQILRLYNSAGFAISTIHVDNKFRPLMEKVKDNLNVDMNYANPGDHVPEIERNNGTVKERSRSLYYRLPFRNLPKLMIRYLAMEVVRRLNYFPV